MAELFLKSWNGFPLIVDSQSKAAPTPRCNDSVFCDEQIPKPAALAPIGEPGGPGSCDWPIAASNRSVAGSGKVVEACYRTGRPYIGCEIDPARAERARARLASLLPFDSGRPA